VHMSQLKEHEIKSNMSDPKLKTLISRDLT
jgi:hypothetical protein